MAKKVLVAVYSASGVTRRVGEEIARISGGDFFEIMPKEPYTSADLFCKLLTRRCLHEG